MFDFVKEDPALEALLDEWSDVTAAHGVGSAQFLEAWNRCAKLHPRFEEAASKLLFAAARVLATLERAYRVRARHDYQGEDDEGSEGEGSDHGQ